MTHVTRVWTAAAVLLSCFLLFAPATASAASVLETPGTGVVWTLDSLEAHDEGFEGSFTWSEAQGQWLSYTPIVVNAGDRLIIDEPILFYLSDATADLTVLGEVIAGIHGSVTDTLVIRGEAPVSGSNGPGTILIQQNGVFDGTRVRMDGFASNAGLSAFHVQDSGTLTLRGSVVTHWGEFSTSSSQVPAIMVESGTLYLENTSVSYNAHHGIWMHQDVTATIKGCTFEKNNSYTVDMQGGAGFDLYLGDNSSKYGNSFGNLQISVVNSYFEGFGNGRYDYGVYARVTESTAQTSTLNFTGNYFTQFYRAFYVWGIPWEVQAHENIVYDLQRGGSYPTDEYGDAFDITGGVSKARFSRNTISLASHGIRLNDQTTGLTTHDYLLGDLDGANTEDQGRNITYLVGQKGSSGFGYHLFLALNENASSVMAENNWIGTADSVTAADSLYDQYDPVNMPTFPALLLEPMWANPWPVVQSMSPGRTLIAVEPGVDKTFTVNAVDPLDPSTAVSVSWVKNGVTIGSGTSVTTSFSEGDHYVQAVITGTGSTGTLDWKVRAGEYDMGPIIRGTSPAAPFDTVEVNTTKDFAVTAVDPNGDALTYALALNGVDMGGANPGSLTFDVVGSQTVTMTVSDIHDNFDQVTWMVEVTAENQPPVISARTPTDSIFVSPSQSNTFSVTASDPDGDDANLTYTWVDDGFTTSETGSSITRLIDTAPDTSLLVVTVTDEVGKTATAAWAATYDPALDAVVITELPREYSLNAYPNPFNAATQLAFTLPKASPVELKVFDVTGRLVDSMELGTRAAGLHRITWHAPRAASGVYFLRFQAGSWQATKKLMLVR